MQFEPQGDGNDHGDGHGNGLAVGNDVDKEYQDRLDRQGRYFKVGV